MKSQITKVVVAIALAFAADDRLLAQSGLDQAQPFSPFLNGAFPSETPGTTIGGTWATENAFPNLTFPEPVRIVENPHEAKLVVVSKTGPIWIFDNSNQTSIKQLLLDLSSKTNYPSVGEGGVTGFAFHPDFGLSSSPNRGYIYVAYRYTPEVSGVTSPEQPGYNRIARFTVPDGSKTADPNSELILINQYDRQQWHIGGGMFFGIDNFLYIGLGDEGNLYSRMDSTQRLDGGLWSGVVRIDVDNNPARSSPIRRQPRDSSQINSAMDSAANPRPTSWPPSFTQGYSIPLDNPFHESGTASQSSVLEEFYCIGLRHPWSISQDPTTGEIWAGDVGQDEREEIDRLVKGGNYQWGFKEGLDVPGPIGQPSPLIGVNSNPILDYSHTVGLAVIGAGVYRGGLFPELQGKYLFSDFNNGQLWAIKSTENGPISMRDTSSLPSGVEFITQLPAGFSAGVNAHTVTRDGNLLMAKSSGGSMSGGTILKLVRYGAATAQPPALLSQTGAFKNLSTLTPANGFIPYSLNVPFWSDNAIKTRWIAIPNDGTYNTDTEKIKFTAQGDWNFPIGSVAIKHFEISLDLRNPTQTHRLETRFLINGNQGWYGVSYRWNQAGTDAELIYEGQAEALQITNQDSQVSSQTWTYPSRTQCLTCHTPNAGGSIGLMTRQLNKDQFYNLTGRTANQLTTFSALGIFQNPVATTDLPDILTLKSTSDPDATLSQKARSYLDSNCSYCHQPGGVRANFDARYTTPLSESGMLFGSLVENSSSSGGSVIVPGDTSHSAIYQRSSSAGQGQSMPPLAKDKVDTAGVSVITAWINSLASTLGNNTATGGNFIDSHHPSLYVNKSDVFTNLESSLLTITLTDFSFFAAKLGNPITPFVATVSGPDSFTIKAIGTTRTSSDYQIGSNHFPFLNDLAKTLTLAPGETIVTGFMDSYPNGTGWGAGSVIPATTGGSSEDHVWALLPNPLILQSTSFNSSIDTPTIAPGENILITNAGKLLTAYPNLDRSYNFSISYVQGDSGGSAGAVDSTNNNLNILANGSFESGFNGWSTSGNLNIQSGQPYAASHGTQLVSFNAQNLTPNGMISQSFPTVPGKSYTLTFDLGVLSYNSDLQSVVVAVTGSGPLLSKSISIAGLGGGTNFWLPQTQTFVANSTTTVLSFKDTSTLTIALDLLLDNIVVTGPSGSSNTAPIAIADSYVTTQNIPIVISPTGVLANDTDGQSDTLVAILDTNPDHGSLSLSPYGGFTYTPVAGFTGGDSFTYHVSDGNLNSDSAIVQLTVSPAIIDSLVNGSFESGLQGWTSSGNVAVFSNSPYQAADGVSLIGFNSQNSTPNGILAQSFSTVVGKSYKLIFQLGTLSYNTNQQAVLVTITGSGGLLSKSVTIPGLSGGINHWTQQSFSFTANSTTSTLTFQDNSMATVSLDMLLDKVEVTAVSSSFNNQDLFFLPTLTKTSSGVSINMMSSTPGKYVLQSSRDLKSWTSVDTVDLPSRGKVEFNQVVSGESSMFYRIALPEPK